MEASIREEGAPRALGTFARPVFVNSEIHIKDFLGFINRRHCKGTVAHIRVEDLPMTDIEMFTRYLVDKRYSASQVGKRMQMVKRIIDQSMGSNASPGTGTPATSPTASRASGGCCQP